MRKCSATWYGWSPKYNCPAQTKQSHVLLLQLIIQIILHANKALGRSEQQYDVNISYIYGLLRHDNTNNNSAKTVIRGLTFIPTRALAQDDSCGSSWIHAGSSGHSQIASGKNWIQKEEDKNWGLKIKLRKYWDFWLCVWGAWPGHIARRSFFRALYYHKSYLHRWVPL